MTELCAQASLLAVLEEPYDDTIRPSPQSMCSAILAVFLTPCRFHLQIDRFYMQVIKEVILEILKDAKGNKLEFCFLFT